MRTSGQEYRNGFLFDGYDYTRQAWVVHGVYIGCGHEGLTEDCNCYGREHAGEKCFEPDHDPK